MKKQIISANEKLDRFYWFILNKIKESLLLGRNTNKVISYNLFLHPQTNDWDKPNSLVEQRLLENLKKLGLMEEANKKTYFEIGKESETDSPKSAGITYYFKMNKALFNNYYKRYQKLMEQYEKAHNKGNTLTFYNNGELIYIDPIGKEYPAKLKTETNSYHLLKFLVHNSNEVHRFGELAKNLKKTRSQVDSSDDERRVRDTIQSIKEKLQYHGDDLFESDYGFGLKCNVLIKK